MKDGKTKWGNGIAEWTIENVAFVSSVFSWNLHPAYMRCIYYKTLGYHVRCGGQTVAMNPSAFAEFDTSGEVDALTKHNPNAVFTSRGCIRNCSFCLVPSLEGKLIELDDWPVRPIICDNNILATTQEHFDLVIDRLIESKIKGIDFNQGLDARILKKHHAEQLARLPKDTIVRLAWDNIKTEELYLNSFNKLVMAGIKPSQIRTYVLIGYKDTPEDALYRLEKIESLGALTNPMRYQPLDAIKKNSYVERGWSNKLLNDYMRYWSNRRVFRNIKFKDYKK